MRPLKPMVGVVKSLGYYRRGPVGLVHRQKVRFFQKKNPLRWSKATLRLELFSFDPRSGQCSHAALNAEANSSTMFEFRRARASPRQKQFGPGAFDLFSYRVLRCHQSAEGVC